MTWWPPFLRPSSVRIVEARESKQGRWTWVGLDITGSTVAMGAGNWQNSVGALTAGRAVFPRAFYRTRMGVLP